MNWEYRFITIAVRPPQSQSNSSRGANPGEGRAAGRVPGVSPSYQELEFPAQYGDGTPVAKATSASALPRAKQVEQVVNRLAAEGWKYVSLEMLLRDQVLVMRRRRTQSGPSQRQPWWIRLRRMGNWGLLRK